MKIGRLRTKWIIFISLLYTGYISFLAVFKGILSSKSDRVWVDNVIHRWVDGLLKLLHVECQVINPQNVQPTAGKPTIIMCNHTSAFDIPISFKAFPKHSIRMLAKKELSKIPLFSRAMRVTEFPFIDRQNRTQAFKDLEYMQELMKSGILIWVAPEGTRSKDGQLKLFKKGAFITAIQAQATIIPIAITGAYEILPPNTYNLRTHQTTKIHIGLPIDAAKYTVENKDELVLHTHEVIKQLLSSSKP